MLSSLVITTRVVRCWWALRRRSVRLARIHVCAERGRKGSAVHSPALARPESPFYQQKIPTLGWAQYGSPSSYHTTLAVAVRPVLCPRPEKRRDARSPKYLSFFSFSFTQISRRLCAKFISNRLLVGPSRPLSHRRSAVSYNGPSVGVSYNTHTHSLGVPASLRWPVS